MFKELKDQENASRVEKLAGQFDEGIKLYKYFKEAVDKQDKVRSPRLAIKLDNWYNILSDQCKTDFCRLLCDQGLITGPLAAAIRTFEGRFQRLS